MLRVAVTLSSTLVLVFLHSVGANAGLVDDRAGKWTQLSDGPWSAREGLMAATLDDGIYMTGGRKFFGAQATSDAWYSANGSSWTQLPKTPFQGRAYHAMMAMKGCLYVMGGQTVSFIGDPFFNDVWRSCDKGQSWKMIANAPWRGRAGPAFTIFNRKMVIAGGCYGSSIGSGRLFLNDVWASADGIAWEQLTAEAPWKARSGPRLVVFDGKLMIIAGERGFTPDTQLKDIWTSGDGKDWKLLTASPAFSARSGHGAVVFQNQIFVIAGWNNNLCIHDMWSSIDGTNWEERSNSTWNCNVNSCGKFDFWPVVTNDGKKILTLGGSNAYSTFGKMWADTWELDLDSQRTEASIVV